MLKDLGHRFVVAVISITMAVLLLLFAKHPYVQYLVGFIVSLLTAVAVWEYAQFAKAKGGKPKSPAIVLLSALIVFSFFLSSHFDSLRLLPQAFFVLAILILFALHFREKTGAIVDLAVSTFGLLYIALPMGLMLATIYLPMKEDGSIWVAYLLSVTKITDIGAYFGGSLWGRRKLAPHISPAKTIEGAFFGMIFALLVSYIFYRIGVVMPVLHFHLSTGEWIFLGLIFGSIGQFGDLSESLLKRDANKKDSNILPGIGGVLDALDSLLFNAPILYFYLLFFRIMGANV